MMPERLKTLDGKATLQYTFNAESCDMTSLDILANAVIPGIMRPTVGKIDDDIILTWNADNAVTAEDYLKNIKPDGLFSLLRGICSSVLAAENYMLESSRLIMSPDLIFVDRKSGTVSLLCIPDELLNDKGAFTVYETSDGLEYIVDAVSRRDAEDDKYPETVIADAASAEEVFASMQVFSPGDCSVRLAMAVPDREKRKEEKQAPSVCSGPEADGEAPTQSDEVDRILERFDGFCAEENEEEEAEIAPAGDVTDTLITFGFLIKNFSLKNLRVYFESLKKNRRLPYSVSKNTEKAPHAVLTEIGSRKAYDIGELPYTVGKSSKCSLSLPYARFVSRRHAEITYDGGKYYIRDVGSTNGTFVGGARLEPGEIAGLKSGDAIAVGEMLFVFSSDG